MATLYFSTQKKSAPLARFKLSIGFRSGEAEYSSLLFPPNGQLREPYHVRLEILEVAGFTRNCSEDMRERLIAAIHEINQSNLGFGIS